MPNVGGGAQKPLVRLRNGSHLFYVGDIPYFMWQIMLFAFYPFRVVLQADVHRFLSHASTYANNNSPSTRRAAWP